MILSLFFSGGSLRRSDEKPQLLMICADKFQHFVWGHHPMGCQHPHQWKHVNLVNADLLNLYIASYRLVVWKARSLQHLAARLSPIGFGDKSGKSVEKVVFGVEQDRQDSSTFALEGPYDPERSRSEVHVDDPHTVWWDVKLCSMVKIPWNWY